MPFAALKGFDSLLAAVARHKEEPLELSEEIDPYDPWPVAIGFGWPSMIRVPIEVKKVLLPWLVRAYSSFLFLIGSFPLEI